MVWAEICYDRNMWVEFLDVLKLKAADFQYVYIVFVLQKCLGKTVANISSQACVNPTIRKQVMREHRCGCFAIATRNAN